MCPLRVRIDDGHKDARSDPLDMCENCPPAELVEGV